MKPSRRNFLASSAAAAALLTSPLAWADGGWMLSYGRCTSQDAALDIIDELENVLGESIARDLVVVRMEDRSWHPVLKKANRSEAEALQKKHAAKLKQEWGEASVTLVSGSNARPVYNISYGLGPNFAALKEHYPKVVGMLGVGVARDLVIEKTSKGNYALVYRRYGGLQDTEEAAHRHSKLLRGTNVSAASIPHRNNPIVYSGTVAESAPISAAAARRAPPVTPKAPETPKVVSAPSPKSAAADMGSFGGTLSEKINSHVKGLRSKGQVASDEQTSWLVYDLKNDKPLAAINPDSQRQCASMVKPFIALAFFHRAARKELVYGPTSKAKFEAMIQRSSNTATDWAMKQVGGPAAVHRILTQSYGHLFKKTKVVEYIGSQGRTYKNAASAADYGRFLKALWNGELPSSLELLRLMNLPGRDRLYNGAPSIPVGTRLYDKTGSTGQLCGDMGIIVAKDRKGRNMPYIMVGIVQKSVRCSSYGSWINSRSSVIRSVSDLVYRELKPRYSLR